MDLADYAVYIVKEYVSPLMVFHDGSGKIPLVRVFGLSGASTVSGLRGFRVKGL